MNAAKGVTLILVGIALGLVTAWLMPQRAATNEAAEMTKHLVDFDRRLTRLERTMSDAAVPIHNDTSRQVDHLREAVNRLQEQVASLTPASVSPGVSTNLGLQVREPRDASRAAVDAEPWSSEARIEPRQLERLVTEVVASLAPKYVEEQVSQLYAAQKQADEAAQQEAEQRRREEGQERRLAQLINDLHTFVPSLSPVQVEEVGQAIKEQWEVMGAMRRQAWEQGTFITPGEILQRARELTDEKLYAILSPLQVEAFRLWREARFGAPESVPR